MGARKDIEKHKTYFWVNLCILALVSISMYLIFTENCFHMLMDRGASQWAALSVGMIVSLLIIMLCCIMFICMFVVTYMDSIFIELRVQRELMEAGKQDGLRNRKEF